MIAAGNQMIGYFASGFHFGLCPTKPAFGVAVVGVWAVAGEM
jgi:hypothetical protein